MNWNYSIGFGGAGKRNRILLCLLSFAALDMYSFLHAREIPGRDSSLAAVNPANIVYMTSINSPISIDGTLDEPAWAESVPVGGFIQQEPFDNAPATEETMVRVLRDEGSLYFAFTCMDNEPDGIIANEMRRDGHLSNNDNIEIFLDTFNDKKNCYYFSTNPAGAKVDALISEEGKDSNESWNGIWHCATKRNREGWTAEIEIPLYSLRFKGSIESWGINFGREIRRKTERTFWSYIPRALMQSGKYKASLFGRLMGTENLSKGKNLDIVPYVKGSDAKEYGLGAAASDFNGGVDLSYRVTGNLRTEFSYKTDFAQVEADQEVVNVSRYDLLFPEKREFFLENAGLFQFGDMVITESATGGSGGRLQVSTAGISNSESNYLLFYSRRIGLHNEIEIPLHGGTKITGKSGKNAISLMSMQTMEKSFADGTSAASTNYSAFRVKRDLLGNSSIGVMVLNKQNAPDVYNRSFGIDGNFPLTTSLTVGGSLAKTATPGLKGKDYAETFFIDLRKDAFAWNAKYIGLDDNFNPEMGYLRRGRIRGAYTSATARKWINKSGIRNLVFNAEMNYVTNNQNVLESKYFSGTFVTFLSSGDRVSVAVNRDYDFLKYDDIIGPVALPRGDYRFDSYKAYVSTDHGRWLAGTVEYTFGEYYGGKIRTLSPHYHFKPSPHFCIDTFYDYNHVELPYGRFYSNVVGNRITYMFNPDFYIKTYTQWNNIDKRLSSNILLHYIYNAANNFYLVYNENRNPDSPGMNLRDRVIMLKFSYHFFV